MDDLVIEGDAGAGGKRPGSATVPAATEIALERRDPAGCPDVPLGDLVEVSGGDPGLELAFDQGPGELFVMRVAGNIVTPNLLASLEYGAQFLGAPLIMVLGHSGCGAVDAAIKVLKDKVVLPGHLPDLIAAIKPAVIVAGKTTTGNLLDNAVAENVRRQVARLKSAAPVIQKLYASKKIDIVGAVYELATGKIALL